MYPYDVARLIFIYDYCLLTTKATKKHNFEQCFHRLVPSMSYAYWLRSTKITWVIVLFHWYCAEWLGLCFHCIILETTIYHRIQNTFINASALVFWRLKVHHITFLNIIYSFFYIHIVELETVSNNNFFH